MDLNKKRWMSLFASCFVMLCIGSLYSWSVFAIPMAEHLSALTGTKIGSLAIVFTISNSLSPITMILGGTINDNIGPKWVIFAGGLLFGGGMILSGFATGVPTLIITYGIMCGLGCGTVYGTAIANSVKFFPDRKGLVGGITTASYGISSVLTPPIFNALIESVGVTNTFKIAGAVMLVIICTAAFFIKRCPPDYWSEGHSPLDISLDSKTVENKNWKRMLVDPLFYIMIMMLTCGAFSGLMIISQVSPVAQRMIGMTAAAAATTVSVLALFNAAGRVVAGFVSDKIGIINTVSGVFILAVFGVIGLYFCDTGSVVQFYLAVSLVGICFGSIMGVFPGFTAFKFGFKNNSVNYGIMFIGFSIAAYLGPLSMSYIYNTYGSYQPAFPIAAAMALAGLALTFVFRTVSKAKKI